jgi:hypothetical protein
MLPHNRMANSSMSNVPKVSEYIVANDRRVKHQPICVDANATLPRSGDKRYLSSGSIPLPGQLEIHSWLTQLCLRNDRVDLFDCMFDLEERFAGR